MTTSTTSPVWVTLVSVFVGAIVAVLGNILANMLNWSTERTARRTNTERIKSLLRSARFYCDRGSNEVRYHASLRIYTDDWDRQSTLLLAQLDAGRNTLSPSAIGDCYGAAFACQQAVFGSRQNFGNATGEPGTRTPQALLELVERATQLVEKAQATIGDELGDIYYKSRLESASSAA